jgi:Leucine-rich repeat (LRR) protein
MHHIVSMGIKMDCRIWTQPCPFMPKKDRSMRYNLKFVRFQVSITIKKRYSQFLLNDALNLNTILGVRNHLNRQRCSTAPANKGQNEVNNSVNTEIIRLISEIRTIKRLDLSNNLLQKFPKKLCNLISMESLNLSGNSLNENDFPTEIEQYQNLIDLNLSDNDLKKIPKSLAMKCNKHMLRLCLSNNQLNDSKLIDHFRMLRILLLNNNNLNNIEELNVKQLQKLEVLDMKHNAITSVPVSLFKDNGMNNIRQLDLSFNKISHICFEIFKLPYLEILNLSNNNLHTLPSVSYIFERSFPITLLDLSSNSINRFYGYLLNMSDNIDLCSNRIKVLPTKTFLKLTNRQVASKRLAVFDNPMREPPLEVINNSKANGSRSSLNEIREYFVDKDKRKQINKSNTMVLNFQLDSYLTKSR